MLLATAAAKTRAALSSLRRRLARRVDDTSGAVTVDWVVLSAAIIGLGVGIIGHMIFGTNALGTKTAETLSDATIKDIAFD